MMKHKKGPKIGFEELEPTSSSGVFPTAGPSSVKPEWDADVPYIYGVANTVASEIICCTGLGIKFLSPTGKELDSPFQPTDSDSKPYSAAVNSISGDVVIAYHKYDKDAKNYETSLDEYKSHYSKWTPAIHHKLVKGEYPCVSYYGTSEVIVCVKPKQTPCDLIKYSLIEVNKDDKKESRILWRHGTNSEAISDVSVDIKGFIYLCDFMNNRINVYNGHSGSLLQRFRLEDPDVKMKFSRPTSLSIDGTGRLLVAHTEGEDDKKTQQITLWSRHRENVKFERSVIQDLPFMEFVTRIRFQKNNSKLVVPMHYKVELYDISGHM